MFQEGLEKLVCDAPEFGEGRALSDLPVIPACVNADIEPAFELWRIIKAKALHKIESLHRSVRYGTFIGSNVYLPVGGGRSMELDLLGQHEDGLFILELKVDKSAERNAFSELLAYSNYLAEAFALSGHKDITNILVANLDATITGQAFLHDLIIADRNIIVYKPSHPDGTLEHAAIRPCSNRRRF